MVRRIAPVPVLALTALLLSAVLSALPAHAAIVEPPAPEGHAQQASPAGSLLAPGARIARRSDALWATVNICDTFESPDAMGIRASMPGNGTSQRMYMRFSAQWYSGLQSRWVDVAHGTSPWVYAGSARYQARQAGWSFDFQTPSYGHAYILRGTVQYQWRSMRRTKSVRRHRRVRRAGYRVARERQLLTTTGVRGVRGSDPKGTSKAMCAIANLDGAE
jgi:hypothetical protein